MGTYATHKEVQALENSMADIQATLHNIVSLQKNQNVCKDYQHICDIVAKDNHGLWAVSSHFPNTVRELVALNHDDMLHLQEFYQIQLFPLQSPTRRELSLDTDSILFREITRTFGLTFWLKEELEE